MISCDGTGALWKRGICRPMGKWTGPVEGRNVGTVALKGSGQVKGRTRDGCLECRSLLFHAERSLDLGFKWNLTTILNEGSRI